MLSYIRQRIRSLNFKISMWWNYAIRPPEWSILRTFGQSKFLSLTVLAPFVGSLVLFNQQIIDWLMVSPILSGAIASGDIDRIEMAKKITINRLEITYFGLVFIGLASFIFAAACPREIKKYPSVSDYIDGEAPLTTKARAGILVSTVAGDYAEHAKPRNGFELYPRGWSYPNQADRLFYAVFNEIANNADFVDDSDESDETDTQDADDPENKRVPWAIEAGIVGMNGLYQIDRIAEIVSDHARVYAIVWRHYEDSASDYKTDLLTLRYLKLDNSIITIRLIVVMLYALGFTILSIPTAQTFAAISGRALGI